MGKVNTELFEGFHALKARLYMEAAPVVGALTDPHCSGKLQAAW